MKKVIIIPARYQSSRFPGKPLIDILGQTLLQRVYAICKKTGMPVYVATDDKRIKKHCDDHDMDVIMTPNTCLTGTDRLYEVAKKLDYDLYINVQGDEPLIGVNDINAVIGAGQVYYDKVCCGMTDILNEEDYTNVNVPKVVTNSDKWLLYMSRAPIPANKDGKFIAAKKQVCIYSFPKNALMAFGEYGKKSTVEAWEDIEILRFFELGTKIKMVNVSGNSVAVDVPADIDKVVAILEMQNGSA